MSFLAVEYFVALTGLLVPIAIHLWSRKEGKVIKVGSVRFFPIEETKRSESIRLHETGLLFLRSLLVALVVLLLAQPMVSTPFNDRKHVVFIEKTLWFNDQFAEIKDSLTRAGQFELRFLKQEFPLVTEAGNKQASATSIRYWQLLTDAVSLGADSVSVFALSRLAGIAGRRPELPYVLQWYTLPDDEKETLVVDAYDGGEGINVIRAVTDFERTGFQHHGPEAIEGYGIQVKKLGDNRYVKTGRQEYWIKVRQLETQSVNIWYEQGFMNDVYYLEAAFKAIEEHLSIPIQVSHLPIAGYKGTEHADLIVYLSNSSEDIANDNTLVYANDPLSRELISPSDQPGKYYLTSRLSHDVAFQQDLVAQLLPVVFSTDHIDSIIAIHDRRIATHNQVMARQEGIIDQVSGRQTQAGPAYSLWGLLALVFLAERIMSFVRKQ